MTKELTIHMADAVAGGDKVMCSRTYYQPEIEVEPSDFPEDVTCRPCLIRVIRKLQDMEDGAGKADALALIGYLTKLVPTYESRDGELEHAGLDDEFFDAVIWKEDHRGRGRVWIRRGGEQVKVSLNSTYTQAKKIAKTEGLPFGQA